MRLLTFFAFITTLLNSSPIFGVVPCIPCVSWFGSPESEPRKTQNAGKDGLDNKPIIEPGEFTVLVGGLSARFTFK